MGCNIHAYIEYREPTQKHWSNFGEQFRLDRWYGMFAKLADVRNRLGEMKPISKPKGLPNDLGWKTKYGNLLYMESDKECDCDNTGYCSKSDAENWVKHGSSEIIDEHWVTHPDWHSHSWLTTKELEEAFSDELLEFDEKKSPDYGATLNVMKYFESIGYETRLVFWFDN